MRFAVCFLMIYNSVALSLFSPTHVNGITYGLDIYFDKFLCLHWQIFVGIYRVNDAVTIIPYLYAYICRRNRCPSVVSTLMSPELNPSLRAAKGKSPKTKVNCTDIAETEDRRERDKQTNPIGLGIKNCNCKLQLQPGRHCNH